MKKHSIIAALAAAACLVAITGATGCKSARDKGENIKSEADAANKKPRKGPLTKRKPIMRDYEGTPLKIGEKPDSPYKNTVDFEGLKQLNADIYAWVKIPNTAVDYPILQSTEQPDDYYLNRTVELYEGYPGSIYTEKRNSQDFMDPVTLIYGHDMLDGSMFAGLHKYEDADFFAENPYFYIYLPDKTLKYRIFSAVAFNDRHILKVYDFESDGELMRFYNDLMRCETGNVDNTARVTSHSRIVTMSTCIGPRPDQRWLVSGVLISIEKKSEDG